MYTLQQTTFICFLLFVLIQISNSIKCYECVTCPDDFDPTTSKVITKPDNQGYSCAKYWAANTKVIRYVLRDCTADNTEGIGTFCCDTDFCNDASKIISMYPLLFSLVLVVILKFV